MIKPNSGLLMIPVTKNLPSGLRSVLASTTAAPCSIVGTGSTMLTQTLPAADIYGSPVNRSTAVPEIAKPGPGGVPVSPIVIGPALGSLSAVVESVSSPPLSPHALTPASRKSAAAPVIATRLLRFMMSSPPG